MYTDNTIHKINKNNPAEMDRNRSKAYRVPVQFPVIACTRYLVLLSEFCCLNQQGSFQHRFEYPWNSL